MELCPQGVCPGFILNGQYTHTLYSRFQTKFNDLKWQEVAVLGVNTTFELSDEECFQK